MSTFSGDQVKVTAFSNVRQVTMAGGDRGTIGELLVAMLDEQLLESRSSGVLASDVLRCFGVWVVHRAPVSFQVAWPYDERVLDMNYNGIEVRMCCSGVMKSGGWSQAAYRPPELTPAPQARNSL